MKKLSLYSTILLTLGIGVTGCKEDTEPRLEYPTQFVLQMPDFVDQLLAFGETEENGNITSISFDVDQPNYGIPTQVDYQVQLAKSEADFSKWDEMVAQNGNENGDYTDEDGLPLVSTLQPPVTSRTITITSTTFCEGLNSIYGFTDENYDDEVVPVSVRIHAWIPNSNVSSIFSNVVTLEKVQSYIPITEAGSLYLIGAPNGWTIDDGSFELKETGLKSKIYTGIFEIPEGKFTFRFYSKLGDWNANSFGSIAGYADENDADVDISFENGSYTGEVYDGKGKWNYPGWEGGTVEMIVNLNDMTVSFSSMTESRSIYIIGAFPGWDINNSSAPLVETTPGSDVYTGEYDVPAGEFQLRFYSQLGDWEYNSIGSQDEDAPIDITFDNGVYQGPCLYNPSVEKAGKGSWQVSGWPGGKVSFTVDLKNLEVTFEQVQ